MQSSFVYQAINPDFDFCRVIFMDGLWTVFFVNIHDEPLTDSAHFAFKPEALSFALEHGFINPEILDYSS
jgi:hypothetical protein